MKELKRILLVEDDGKDAELTLLALRTTRTTPSWVRATVRAEGIACDCMRVETKDQFVAAPQGGQCDVILADFSLPGFHGRDALSLAAEKCPNVPFIFVSGVIGEEAANESLRSGATDYVLKQKISRLVPAVRRALAEAEKRQRLRLAEADLRESEERARLGCPGL